MADPGNRGNLLQDALSAQTTDEEIHRKVGSARKLAGKINHPISPSRLARPFLPSEDLQTPIRPNAPSAVTLIPTNSRRQRCQIFSDTGAEEQAKALSDGEAPTEPWKGKIVDHEVLKGERILTINSPQTTDSNNCSSSLHEKTST